MSKNPTSSVLDQAWKLYVGGKTNAEIMTATGLNYSQMWNDRFARQLKAGDVPKGFEAIKAEGMSTTALGAAIAKARLEGQSWGVIMIRCNMTEGRVRKAFAEATAIDSRGLRVGKGGRYVADEPTFYTGSDRAKLGTELVPSVPALAQVPDPEAEAVRNLPKVVKRLIAPKTTLTAEQKAERAAKAKATREAKAAAKAEAAKAE